MTDALILRDLPNDVYHGGGHPYVGHSKLRDFVEHGERFYYERHVLGTLPRKETEELRFGIAFEELFQRGGDAFDQLVAVPPSPQADDGRTAAGKAFRAASQDKIQISRADYDAMIGMSASLRSCEKGMALIDGCEQQVTLRGEVFGLPMQGRPDWLHLSEFGAYAVDLKTTKNLNDYLDGPAVWKFAAHVQAALFRRLLAANGYPDASSYLFVVEKCVPYRRAVFEIPAAYLAWGDTYLREHAPRLARCIERDEWPLGPDEIVQLEVPRWVRLPEAESAEVSP